MKDFNTVPDLRSYISFIGKDRFVQWSHLRFENAESLYQKNPAENTCCAVMKVLNSSCNNCPSRTVFLNRIPAEAEKISPDGRAWKITVYPSFDSNGNFCGIYETGNIISERLNIPLLPQNAEYEREYRLHIENQNNLIVEKDMQGRFQYVSPSFCDFFNIRGTELLGKTFIPYIHADDRNLTSKAHESLSRSPFRSYVEHRALTNAGWRWMAWSEKVIFDEKDGTSSILGVGNDIHDQKIAEHSRLESERRLSTLMTNLPGLAYRCKNDKEWTMEFVSHGCFDLTGYLPEEITGNKKLSFNELILPEFQSQVWTEWQTAILEKRPYTGEYQIYTAEGNQKWVWEQGRAVYNVYGEVVALEGFILDISEQKKNVIALHESEEKYRDLIDSALVGIYSTKTTGEILLANKALCRMLEYESCDDLLAVENVANFYKNKADRHKMIEDIREKGNLDGYEITWETQSGREIIVVISAILKGDIISGMVMDVTQRKLAEKQVFIEKERAEQSDKLKAAFLANISHEIRTPLNGILGFTDILLEQDIAKTDKEHYSNVIHSLSEQLLSIVNDIFEISKIETNQLQISLSPINVNQILDKLYSGFEKSASEKSLSLILSSEFDENQCNILGDGIRINQVLSHLLNNALKFTNSGSISFGCSIHNDMLLFHVKDTGIGIRTEDQEIIFERFRQVEDTLTRKFGGSGLGLSISKALVEMMGGKIFVESAPNLGSAFYFTIPFAMNLSAKNNHRNPLDSRSCLEGCKILICEDDDFGYLLINRLLSQAGCMTVRALNGSRAIKICQLEEDIDLVIMDLRMPEMTGTEAAEAIKKIMPSVPIIVCTASSVDEIENALNKKIFDDVVFKPIKNANLLSTICKLL